MEFYFQQFWIHQTWNIYAYMLREKNEKEEKEKRQQGEGEDERKKKRPGAGGPVPAKSTGQPARWRPGETDAARGVPSPSPGRAPSEELSVSFKAFCCLFEARPHEGEYSALLRATDANGNLLSKYFTAASKACLSKLGYRAGRVDTASQRRPRSVWLAWRRLCLEGGPGSQAWGRLLGASGPPCPGPFSPPWCWQRVSRRLGDPWPCASPAPASRGAGKWPERRSRSRMSSRSPGARSWRRFARPTEVGAECAWLTAPLPSERSLDLSARTQFP